MTMESDRISYHDSVRTVYERLKKDGMSNVWDRYEAQGFGNDPDKRCGFCQSGARCDFCSNGPCRADASRNHRGVCGINADGMAMRMMLLRNVMGASNYHFHAQQAVRTLRATAEGKTPFSIAEPEKLRTFAERLGIDTSGSDAEVALRLCDFVEEDFHRFTYEPSRIVERLAPPERREAWKRLGLFPGGIYGETTVVTAASLTNVDGWFASHAMRAMRLGVAMAYQSQIVLEYIQDILYGIPRPHPMRVDLGVLDPDYVNILPNGHEPFLGFALIDLARTDEWQQKAKAAGAKGLRIIANIETGQELIQRREMDDVFYGYTGNWIMQEAVLATGAVDVFAADMNCSLPLDPLYAEKYHFKLIPVSEVVVFEGGTERLEYVPEEAKEQAAALLQMGIENFKERRGKVEAIRGLPVREAVVGFAPESIVAALGGSLDPLLGAIKDGTIRGVVGLVSCTTLRGRGEPDRPRRPGARDGLRGRGPPGRRALLAGGEGEGRAGAQGALHGTRRPAGARVWDLHRHRPVRRPPPRGLRGPRRRPPPRPPGRRRSPGVHGAESDDRRPVCDRTRPLHLRQPGPDRDRGAGSRQAPHERPPRHHGRGASRRDGREGGGGRDPRAHRGEAGETRIMRRPSHPFFLPTHHPRSRVIPSKSLLNGRGSSPIALRPFCG